MPSMITPPEQLNASLQPNILALLRRYNLLLPLFKGIVEDELLADLRLEPNEIKELFSRWAGETGIEQALEQARQRNGLYREDLDWQLQRPVKLARVAQTRFADKAEARFLQRKRDLDLVTYSLVRVKDANLARELYLQLDGQESGFAELAERYSDGPERLSKGLVGPKPINQAHPQLAERLRTGRDGEVLPPFVVAGWWLVVRRESYQPAVLDEAMTAQMAQELLQEWIAEEAQRRLEQLNAGGAAPS